MNKINKSWLELVLNSNNSNRDILLSLVSKDSIGASIEDKTDKIYFQLDIKDEIEQYLQLLNNRFNFNWNWNIINNNKWHLKWKEQFIPIIISNKITIVPSWDNMTSSEILVKIEPGMAFGTGHHQTTTLAIEILENLIEEEMCVLDLGTGSGIIAIIAKYLGANKIDAVEIDVDCLENFNINLDLNNMKNVISYHNCDVLKWKNFNYDIIVANINRNVILDLIPIIGKTDAAIIITGLLVKDRSIIYNKCTQYNINICNIHTKDEWMAMELRYE